MAQQLFNYIDGEWLAAKSKKTFENRNPANRDDLIGLFPASDIADVDSAVRAAKKAFASWRLVPAPKRGEILYRVGELLKKYKEDLARIETREMGKVLKETRGDVQEGIDCAFLNAGEGRRLFGETTPAEKPTTMRIDFPLKNSSAAFALLASKIAANRVSVQNNRYFILSPSFSAAVRPRLGGEKLSN